MSKPINYQGKRYSSRKALSEKFGVPYATFQYKYKETEDIEVALGLKPYETSRSLWVDGVFFETTSDAARHYGLSIGLVHDRLALGWTPEQAVGLATKYAGNEYVVDGKKFTGYKQLAEHFTSVTPQQIADRIRHGWTIEEAVGVVHRAGNKTLTCHGNTYPNIAALARVFTVSDGTIRRRLNCGATTEQAVMTPKEYALLNISPVNKP